jgi:two-component system, NtrC family, sensor kinase
MNSYLSSILSAIEKAEHLADHERNELIHAIKKVDKELTIFEFKLQRTEKVKRTTSILLEETISELEEKRKAVEDTNAALQKSFLELKAAQAQLIQSEKMASLGELTAGIAHEIQNPLNFVNNFSEVSSELVHELKEELDKGDFNEAKAISDDVIQNLQKIHHHGNRASSIVKGMLEHSRTSSGKKELTDINALADEYLRLAYHGLRAKDKDFNAELVTNFDPNLPKIDVIPQDIGRVLLNLINNAFQACIEQSSDTSTELVQVPLSTSENADSYKPTVSISTKSENDQIIISVKDNGSGIPDEIKDKIFQPFFTTKETGKGTGLGLSLAYDIVKAHGGEIELESKENEATSFTIKLPIA